MGTRTVISMIAWPNRVPAHKTYAELLRSENHTKFRSQIIVRDVIGFDNVAPVYDGGEEEKDLVATELLADTSPLAQSVRDVALRQGGVHGQAVT